MLTVSIVTWNRRDVLEQVLVAMERQARGVPYRVLVTDNGSTDGTAGMLREYALTAPVPVDVWLLPENLGIAKARNAHWQQALDYGQPILRLDDKVRLETPYWPAILAEQAARHRRVICLTDPVTEHLWGAAHQTDLVTGFDSWICGAAMLTPHGLAADLGGWCEEYGLYGHEDLDWIERAALLGYGWGYSVRVYGRHLARASAERRAGIEPYIPVWEANRAAYRAGERGAYISLSETAAEHWSARARWHPGAAVQQGDATSLPWP